MQVFLSRVSHFLFIIFLPLHWEMVHSTPSCQVTFLLLHWQDHISSLTWAKDSYILLSIARAWKIPFPGSDWKQRLLCYCHYALFSHSSVTCSFWWEDALWQDRMAQCNETWTLHNHNTEIKYEALQNCQEVWRNDCLTSLNETCRVGVFIGTRTQSWFALIIFLCEIGPLLTSENSYLSCL